MLVKAGRGNEKRVNGSKRKEKRKEKKRKEQGKEKKNKADRPANSRERWAGALMEVRSLFGLNSAVRKKRATDHGRTDRP